MNHGSSRISIVARPVALALALVASGAACGGDDTADKASPPTAPSTAPSTAPPASDGGPTTAAAADSPNLDAVQASLSRVAAASRPTAMAVRPGDDAIYVTEKTGLVKAIPGGQRGAATASPTPVLDLSGEVSNGGEQGLLGLTFSPDGSTLYVDYTDTAGDTKVVEYVFSDGRADPASRRELLSVDQPFANHNGGQIAFGPDGKLYIGLGDGGGQRDPGNRAQNLGSLLGKILRIDPQPSGSLPYSIPPDNPFVDRPGARPEVWDYGLRNPWRYSWDRQTGDLWIGDVGEDDWEEIDFVPAGKDGGANFGWSLMDSREKLKGDNPAGATLPLFDYSHDDGNCSIAGGFVYRGAAIPALRGAYVYGDTCSGMIWALVQEGGQVTQQRQLDVGAEPKMSSFGEDAAGELYLLDLAGALYRFQP